MGRSVCGQDWQRHLGQTDVILMSNYPSLNPYETDKMVQFLQNGGGVVMLMGDDVDLMNFNRALTQSHLGFSLVNVHGTGGERSGFFPVGNFDFGHPVFSGMFEKGKENFRSPRFFRTVGISGRQFTTLISLADGSPLLIESQTGNGKALFIASGISDKWSDLGYTTLFAPLIMRSTAYLASHFESNQATGVGEPLVMSLDSDYFDTPFHVETPGGESISLLPEMSGYKGLLRLPRAHEPGHYRFYHGNDFLGIQSVNIDSRESDLSEIDLDELQRMIPDIFLHRVSNIEALDASVSRVRYGREFWREILLVVLLILMVEMVLAYGGGRLVPKTEKKGSYRADSEGYDLT
jgi:hypothetical protein